MTETNHLIDHIAHTSDGWLCMTMIIAMISLMGMILRDIIKDTLKRKRQKEEGYYDKTEQPW